MYERLEGSYRKYLMPRNEWYNLGIAQNVSTTDLTSTKELLQSNVEYWCVIVQTRHGKL